MTDARSWKTLLKSKEPEWVSLWNDLIETLGSDDTVLPDDWPDTILSIGGQILEKGTTEQRQAVLEAAKPR